MNPDCGQNPKPRNPIARAVASNASGSWFAIPMSKATPSRCFDAFAPADGAAVTIPQTDRWCHEDLERA